MQQIAPTLFEVLSPAQVQSLEELRSTIEQTANEWEPIAVQYTDHTTTHNDAALSFVETYIAYQDVELSPVEVFALIAAIYLHDIGLLIGESLRDRHGHLPIDNRPNDLRQHHAKLASEFVRDQSLQARASFVLPDFHGDVAGLIADLCQSHDNIESLDSLESYRTVENTETRPKLLGALLCLGDSMHTGRSRVIITNLGLAPLSIESRLFWYGYACINSVQLTPSKVVLSLTRTPEIDSRSFKRQIRDPIYVFFRELLSKLNSVFSEYGLTELTCEARTAIGDFPGTSATRALLTTAVLESAIHKRKEDREKAIKRKIKRKGLIGRNLIDNEFIALRRWSSYTPRMPNWNDLAGQALPSPSHSRGGGYFFVWGKTGIVLDPGYDFLQNFWTQSIHENEGFELSDIGAVIISHAHDDHSHDIEPILSLFHKYRKITGRRKILPLYMSEGTHCKFERLLSITDSAQVVDLVPSDGIQSLSDDKTFLRKRGVNVDFIRTDHNEMPWMRNHTGVALKLKFGDDDNPLVIGYTSDTRYFPELTPFFEDADVLLMHFGNLGPRSSSEGYDPNHLGLKGCHDLITSLVDSDIQLFLIGEFGEEEIGGDRIKLCELLTQMCSLEDHGKVLLPMDIGMRIKLPSLDVFCQEEGHNHWVKADEIKPHLPAGSDGIVYYCH